MNISAQVFKPQGFSLTNEMQFQTDQKLFDNSSRNSNNNSMNFFPTSPDHSVSLFDAPPSFSTNMKSASTISVSGFSGVACCECGSHFFQIEHYVAHLEETGHKKRSSSGKTDGSNSPQASSPPQASDSGLSYMPAPTGFASIARPPPVTSAGQRILATPPHTPQRVPHTPKSVGKYQKPKFTLFFGAAEKADSLVGGCGWWIRDGNNTVVTHGSVPVQQPYRSLPRLEYEALLNGLIAAHVKKIRCLCVKSHCELSFLLMQGREVPGLSSVHYAVRDISAAIAKLLPQFQTVEVELISAEQNHYSQKLAKTVIDDFLRRQEKMAFDKMAQLQKAPEESPKPAAKNLILSAPKAPILPPAVVPAAATVAVTPPPAARRFSCFEEITSTDASLTATGTSVSVPVSYFSGWETSFLDGLSFGSGLTSADSDSTLATASPARASTPLFSFCKTARSFHAPKPCDDLLLSACERVGGSFDLGFHFGPPALPSSGLSVDSLLSDMSGIVPRSLPRASAANDLPAPLWDSILKSMHFEILQEE